MFAEQTELLDEPVNDSEVSNKFVKDNSGLIFFHPNNKGTGSALSIHVSMANANYKTGVMVRIALQIPNTKIGDKKVFNMRDKESQFLISLNAVEIGHLIDVFSGRFSKLGYESANGFRDGILHSKNGSTKHLYLEKTESGNFRLNGRFNEKNYGFNVFGRGEVTVVVDFLQRALGLINPTRTQE